MTQTVVFEMQVLHEYVWRTWAGNPDINMARVAKDIVVAS